MKIGIVGCGTVGYATARSYSDYCEVRVFDVDKRLATHSLVDVLECNVVFVCLPTPKEDPVRLLDGFFSQMLGYRTNFVIKSTVPIGTTRELKRKYRLHNLVHSPEFLTARCASLDAHMPSRNIIGGDICECLTVLSGLYHARFVGTSVWLCSSDDSEMLKLMTNAFAAVKVAFFNEARNLADKLKLDWDEIIRMLLADGRIASHHTKVPGPDGMRGFGGACLPKDLNMFISQMHCSGVVPLVCQAAETRNNTIDRREP